MKLTHRQLIVFYIHLCRSSSHDTVLNGAATELSTSFTICNDGKQSQDEEDVQTARKTMEVRLERLTSHESGESVD